MCVLSSASEDWQTAFPWDPPKCAEGAGRSLFWSSTDRPGYPRRSQWTGALANVMPLYVKGWKEGLENYRPAILTLLPGKIMEENCLEHHHTVYTGQPGHQAGLTWAGPAWQTGSPSVARWPTQWIKENMHVIYLGLNKAFGAIPHSILLEKLLLMVRMGALFAGYKTGWVWAQRVVVNGMTSVWWWSWAVLPGAVSGLVIFNIFISDLGEAIECRQHQVEPAWGNPGFNNEAVSATSWKCLGKATFL